MIVTPEFPEHRLQDPTTGVITHDCDPRVPRT